MIMAGPDVPVGHVVSTPVSLVDVFPTVLDCTGTSAVPEDADKPGRSLLSLARGPQEPERVAFSEYHAAGAATGAFMLRKGRYKLVHYVGMRPQLFDLQDDPQELQDLAQDPARQAVLAQLQAELRSICDPEEVDHRAKADQADIVERNGGREAVIRRGTFGATPPPGTDATVRFV
jgi:choline-sulfatase